MWVIQIIITFNLILIDHNFISTIYLQIILTIIIHKKLMPMKTCMHKVSMNNHKSHNIITVKIWNLVILTAF